ncbi:MAG: hypothetical protein NTY60_06180 [Proteobacteria bacterium]|nr:hypothetical protein [Pseudomonadota bacterium]
MYEGFFLVALVVLVVLAMRPKVKYDNPVIIHKPGLYHATLAPQLDRAQDLIERISNQFSAAGDVDTQYFTIHDVSGQYLLAAGFRAGTLYFQAILPALHDNNCKTLRLFSAQVMLQVPLGASREVQDALGLRAAVEAAADQLQIACLNCDNE